MTLSTCPKGRVWDAFVLGLTGVDVPVLAEHLKTCEDCQLLVSDRRAYYSSLAAVARELPTDTIARMLPPPVRLTPINLVEIPSQVESVLAAEGPAEASTPTASTFASEDRRWMVKVVWDSSTGHEKLYLLSSEGEPVAGLLIRLSGLTTDYLTDSKGCVDLGSARWPVGNEPEVSVVMPAATFSLNVTVLPEEVQSSTLVRSGHDDLLKVSMSTTETSRRLRLEIVALAPDLAGKPLRVAVQSDNNSQVLKLEPVMVLDHFGMPGTLDIYLFA